MQILGLSRRSWRESFSVTFHIPAGHVLVHTTHFPFKHSPHRLPPPSKILLHSQWLLVHNEVARCPLRELQEAGSGDHTLRLWVAQMRDRDNEPHARDRPQRTCIKSRLSLPFSKNVAALLSTSILCASVEFASQLSSTHTSS